MQPLPVGILQSSKIRKAATFLKTNALQWWTTLLNQGVVPSTWVQFKQIFAPAWITNTFEVDVMIAWNQLSAINCEFLEEYNAKFWDALLPVSSFKMVPLAEQIEKYCCGLSKGIKKYCRKTSVMNMVQLTENAEVVDDLIHGKPDEDGFKTRRKEPRGKQFSAKGNVTSRLMVPPFKKKPFIGSKPFARNRPFNTGNRSNAENQQFRPPPFSGQRQGFKRHFTGKTIEERKALRDAKKCYICEEGHFAIECPQKNSLTKDDKSDRKGKKPKPSAGLVPDLVKVVYVRNLPESATQEQLWKLFEHHGDITKVMLPQSKAGQPKRDFGFIHFADRSSALKAIEKSEKYVLDGRELETSLAKPPGEKRSGAAGMPSPFGSGILPQAVPARGGFGLPGPNMYGGMAMGFGANRGFGQVQPVIYGRGPTPAGMAMVPMMLPDGRVGYVLQQAGTAISPAVGAYNREDRGSGRGPQLQKQSGGSSSRRYHPY
ncbi:hypothetical protein L7F22_023901 [Adiantum nelumboides]|nr:hypothetical protein [Adiantum nelumboides]